MPNKKQKVDHVTSFSEKDLDGVLLPHDDAMMITMLVANWEMKKILVDNGSSTDIFYYHALKQMLMGDDRLTPVNTGLYCFTGNAVRAEGSIELLVLVGTAPHQSITMIKFLVVKGTSPYNAILGRPVQNLLKAITSAYHQKMKFVTPSGIWEV
ncbi:uncharacterized protein LOC143891103 [Tasmannia lanceolata]|uniref:uncharacterized protein LOC143891103 n=1 Tax=Tasmannia lanceolata TaxID=3420 RepID=UPI0040646F12